MSEPVLDELVVVKRSGQRVNFNGTKIAVAIKTYPDGKVTGKLRSNKSYCDKVAEYFGGGGHPYAAGFRTYDLSYEDTIHELITAITKVKEDLKNETL